MSNPTKTIDARSLCLETDPEMYSREEPSYEFTRRKFTKPQKTNITKDN